MPSRPTIQVSKFVFGFAFAISGLSLLLMTGCPTVDPPGTLKSYAGASTCQACHSGKHTDWSATAHATALETLEAIGQGENAACLGCHTVGFGTGGFVSRASTPEFVGVQCENCHDAAADHAANPGDTSLRPGLAMSSAVCGACHTDAHHPTFDEWQLSKHATALAGLRSNSYAGDSCLVCHSFDYRHALEEQATDSTVVLPTLDNAQFSLECATCHSPHGGVAQNHQLRKPIADLCGECHTAGEAALGDSPHHPQIEVLTGIGAFQVDGSALSVTHTHSSLAANGGAACAQCHVVSHEVTDPTDGDPNVTGHTFNPFDESISTIHQASQYTGCAGCHTDADANSKRTALQTSIDSRLSALAPFFDSADAAYIDPTTLSAADQASLATATFNYKFIDADGSRGVHNPSFAQDALTVAETITTTLTTP